MKRLCQFGFLTLLMCSAAPVLAGEEPLYQPAPAWVEPAKIPAEQIAGGPTVLLADNQKRLEGSKLWNYRDLAIHIDGPDTLTNAGTLAAAWIPDKGDLIINRVEILRGDQVIDVLAGGAKFTVLRREQQLEQRSINGLLTATLAVPGLRVGDVLRAAYTTVQADQALGDKVQSLDALPVEPMAIGMARIKVSWPSKDKVQWRAGPDVIAPVASVQGGFKTIEMALPLPKRFDIPADAPWRFRRPPMLQVSSFSSWQEVSRVLAPHFSTEGAIAPDGEIAGKVAAIVRDTADPLGRAVQALRIVQDDISYLANGLDGGNYLPQSPEQTWSLRYGDCKAKSLLLLAMLRQMGISGEVVVVHSAAGDSVPELLPMPADFDHMIVRAHIGGEDYWLDGTSSGTRLDNIAKVPPFGFALPLTGEGSDLVAMVQRPPTQDDRTVRVVIDQSAGVDLPSLYSATIELNGPLGAGVRTWITQPNETYRDSFVESLIGALLGEGSLLDYSMSYDDDAAKALIKVSGMLDPAWTFERGIAREYLPAQPSGDFSFSPDRARQAWRDIPVQMPGPFKLRTELKLILPEGGVGYEVRGREVVNSEIAGITFVRDAALDGGSLNVTEETVNMLTEVDPADITAEKAKAARFIAGRLSLRAPENVKREWDYSSPADRKLLAPIEAAYAKLIEKDPKNAAPYLDRAAFRSGVLDWAGALADVDAAIKREPTAAAWFSRAHLLVQMGRRDESLDAVRKAFELEPTPENALAEAQSMADLGDIDEALELVDDYEDDFEDRLALVAVKAQLLGMSGKADDGFALLDRLLTERPGDPQLLNNICFHMGIWQVQLDNALARCTSAVESGGWAPPVLDSRAMAYFRLGRLNDALTDLNAALSSAPGLSPSLYMRGIVRTKMGDKSGLKDIELALRMNPSLKLTYARYGIEPPAK